MSLATAGIHCTINPFADWRHIVAVVKTPSAPKDLRVTTVTHNQVTLSWGASESGVTRYIIAMREVGKKKFKTVATVDGSELTCSLATGFEQNKEYIFRVYAENEVILIFNSLFGYTAYFSQNSITNSVCLAIYADAGSDLKLYSGSFEVMGAPWSPCSMGGAVV